MDSNFILRALCFHGQPMQKIWEDERGAGDLQKWGVPAQPSYAIYQERQKYFTFQDRAKRLKLHQFLARKANDLYDKSLYGTVGKSVSSSSAGDEDSEKNGKSLIAIMPPYEIFVNKQNESTARWRCMLEAIKPGDIIYGIITKLSYGTIPSSFPLMVKPLCTAEPLVRYLSDVPIKAYVQPSATAALPRDKSGKERNFAAKDYVCCEVLEVSIDADRVVIGLEKVLAKNTQHHLGVVGQEELPAYYRKANDNNGETYEETLLNSKELLNPNYDILYELNGLNIKDTFSLMSCFKQPFAADEYARRLRQVQASKWAFRAVAEGIEHFKIGNQVEAFQCLNKALNIDPRNVEGLVARGALYANKGSFLKAVEDFEKALKLNSHHANARKYMGETLVALGRSYEEKNCIQEAAKAYQDCLNIIPNHEQARLSLEAIQQRPGSHLFDVFSIAGVSEMSKEKKKKRSNSSSSSNDESSVDSKSDSDSETDSSDSHNKERSLSPLSKRMALHAASLQAVEAANKYSQPFYASEYNATRNPNEFKLDDDDTETRVRKLLQDASKHKKDKVKKSKKKKSKKTKKNSKEKDASSYLEKMNVEEAYNAINGIDIERKLKENRELYERTMAEIKKRQELLEQSTSAAATVNPTADRSQRTPTPPSRGFAGNPYDYGSQSKSTYASNSAPTNFNASIAASKNLQPKLSFQIRKPTKVDKFGMVRIATPLITQRSPSISPLKGASRSRSRSRHRHSSRRLSRSRSRSHNRRTLSRSQRSRSRSLTRQRRGRSRSRSRSRTRSRSFSPAGQRYRRTRNERSFHGRRRTPSPFVPRKTPPPPRRRRSVSRERTAYREPAGPKFGNRVWKRPDYNPPSKPHATGRNYADDGDRWKHDKFDDGPSIEEIDEIINQAQKERKQEIIKRDKGILKKATAGSY